MPTLTQYSGALRSGSNENTLTDLVFHWRFPERAGAAINLNAPSERPYVNEWIAIRDSLVRPMVACRTPMTPPPSGPATPPPSAGGSSAGAAARAATARVALGELAYWGNGATKESNAAVQTRLRDYWVTGAQYPGGYDAKAYWSAAFISWIIRTSGVGGSGANGFAYSSAHGTYVAAARANRYANNANPFKAYRITEVAPRVGDIVVRRYDTAKPTAFDSISGAGYHGDIVTAISGSRIELVGGNVNDSVYRRSATLDAQGRLVNGSNDFVAIVRVY